jgi:predicted O-methyltransferase YrrM
MLRSLVRERREALARVLRRHRDRAELTALKRALPALGGIEAAVQSARGQLETAWRTYVTTVSTPVMAASLELSALVLAIARICQPQRILDLGSGFTSYVLRTHAVEGGSAAVVTVDDDPTWLERSRAFLESHRLPTDEMSSWDEFSASAPPPFQLVVHDLGNMSVRAATLRRVLELTAPDGLLVLDDIHDPKGGSYHATAAATCRRADRRLLPVRPLTLDEYGRFAGIAVSR